MASVQNTAPFPPGPVSIASTLTAPKLNPNGLQLIGNEVGDVLITPTGQILAIPPNTSVLPVDPTGTNSIVGAMMGIHYTLVPATTGNILIRCDFTMKGSVSSAVGASLCYYNNALITAPSNGDPATGNSVATLNFSFPAVDSSWGRMTAYISGLTLGATYWFDMAVITNAGTATPYSVAMYGFEV